MISPNRTKPPRSGCPQQKQLMNKTFLAMMEDSGFDVELALCGERIRGK